MNRSGLITALSGLTLTTCLASIPLLGAGRGQGAIVLHDDAPVYVHSEGDEVEWKMKRGDAVCGLTSNVPLPSTYLFDEVKGRFHVIYFQGEQKGMTRSGWMNPKDLAKFMFDGGCQRNGYPITAKGFSQRWNACFEEGRDNKLETLHIPAPPIPTPMPTATPSPENG
jgi:hypothetical protein